MKQLIYCLSISFPLFLSGLLHTAAEKADDTFYLVPGAVKVPAGQESNRGVVAFRNETTPEAYPSTNVFSLNPLPAGTTISVDEGVSAVIVIPKGLVPGIDPNMPLVIRVYRTEKLLRNKDDDIRRYHAEFPIPLPSILIPILPGTAQIVVFPDGTVKQNWEFTGSRVRVEGAVIGDGGNIVAAQRVSK